MTLSLYTQYAAVTAIFLIVVILIAFSLKSWIDEVRFQVNYTFLKARTPKMNELLVEYEDSFDRHVETTPGMRYHLN